MCECVLRLCNLLAGQTDGVDLIGEGDWPSHVQESDVTVQIDLPVILWVDDDFIDRHNPLSSTLKPGQFHKHSHQFCFNLRNS